MLGLAQAGPRQRRCSQRRRPRIIAKFDYFPGVKAVAESCVSSGPLGRNVAEEICESKVVRESRIAAPRGMCPCGRAGHRTPQPSSSREGGSPSGAEHPVADRMWGVPAEAARSH